MRSLITEAFILLFIAALVYAIGSLRPSEDALPAKKGPSAGLFKGLSVSALIKASLVMSFFAVLVFYHSNASYRFYPTGVSALKMAFKHSGQRVSPECDEAELIKREGERYREILKDKKQVQMNIGKMASCPRERFPVKAVIIVDGKKMLERSYPAAGIKKDLASYISEEFIIPSGVHIVEAMLTDSGRTEGADYTLKESVEFGRNRVVLIRFDDKENSLSIE